MSEFKINPELKKPIPWKLVVIFLCFSVAIILVGISFYKSQKNRILSEYQNGLTTVASLKIGQIQQWHKERLGDATIIRDNEPLISCIKQYFRDKNKPELKAELTKWMKSIRTDYDYSGVLLVDTALKVRLSLPSTDTIAGEIIGKELTDVLKNHRIIMTDLHKSGNVKYVHLDLLIPLVDPESKNQSLTGILILRIDPSILLFPLIQSWPTPSKSSETLLLRRDGDSVLYLNELRHQKNTALNLRLSITNKNLLASKAANGQEGVSEGVDYRNIPVLGYLTGIPGSQWYMVAKVDKEEILSPLKRYVFLIIIVIVLLILINASVFGFWIWNQQAKMYRLKLKDEIAVRESKEKLLESEELFRKLFENMLNGFAYCKMIYADGQPPDFLYINVNEAFESLTGLKNVKGKKVSEVIPGILEADPKLLERYGRVALTGKPEVFETYVESLKMWFSISVYSPQKEYFVAVFDVITLRKQAEEALRENEKRLREAQEMAHLGFWLWDIKTGEVEWSEEVFKIFCLDPETFIPKIDSILELSPWPEDHQRDKELISKAIENHAPGDYEQKFLRPDQSIGYYYSTFRGNYDNNGDLISIVGTVLDITERKKAEEALYKSEKKYRNLFEKSQVGMFRTRIDGSEVLEVNEKLIEILGFSRKEMVGNPSTIRYSDIERRKEMIACLKQNVTLNNFEIGVIAKDNSIKTVIMSLTGYPDEGILEGSFVDITDRKLIEVALRESEDKFKYIFDHSVIGKSITLPTGEINVNRAFCDMMGYSSEELVKRKWQDISHPDDIKATEEIIRLLLSGEKDSVRFIKRYIHKNGSVVWTDVGTALRRDENGKPLYFMTAINNITDRKNAESQIKKLNEELEGRVVLRTEQLEAANKELEAFSYSVSHDLRAPLRSVHGFTKILLEDYEANLDEEGKRICGIISSSATQMGGLIDDLLSFSRIGRSTMNPSEIDMKKMVRLLFENMTSPSERKRIKLKIGKLHQAIGDVTLLGQVWINLLSNAIKYSSKNEISEISVGSNDSGEIITYYIKDNGVGFDKQYSHKLFGVFQRLHTESEFEGNGVGLAIVQRIIFKHGGKVWAEGEVGKGATFYFSLPSQDKRQK